MRRTKPWDTKAACKTKDASLLKVFYSKRKKDIELAKSICNTCPIKRECYNKAVENLEPAGIWGGIEFDLAGPLIDTRVPIVSTSVVYYPISIPSNIVETRKDNARDSSGSLLSEVVSRYIEEENR